IAAERMPWGNMYEFVLTVTWIGAAAWLAVLWNLGAAPARPVIPLPLAGGPATIEAMIKREGVTTSAR
ncbi:hypothetical protein AB0880_33560, partial [Micromonospora chersina]|uniref:hypothetical protein n=1 Tax=Micromonospora chersina TaxID=47854 RepID=UPI0034556C2B